MNEIFQKMLAQLLERWTGYEKHGTLPWNREIAVRDLQYQLGSLSKLMLQEGNYRFREGLTDAQVKQKMGDELADIIGEVLFIAHEYDIDLAKSWDEMLESDRRKISERTGGRNS